MSAAVTPLVIGVTGHRNLSAREVGPLRERVRDFFRQLQREFPGLPLVVLDSLAAGGDQLVAEEALRTGARLIAPLPLARELYVQDFTDADRMTFESLCARAEVVQLPLVPGNTDTGITRRGPARDRQYAQAGVFVASHCHILLALWDGRESDLLGGTGQVVRYHLDGTMPGWIERRHSHPVSLGSGDESLLYHLVCSRQVGDRESIPPLPLQPLQAHWISQEHRAAAADGMPEEFRRMFTNMQQFNTDALRHAGDIQTPAPRQGGAPGQLDCTALDSLFATADRLAIHFQLRVLRAMRGLYVLAALMGVAFVCYSDLPTDLPYVGDAIYVFIALFTAGVYLARLARQRGWHRKYIDYRALAEGLRVQGYWRRAGVGADDPGAFAHDNFMQKQDVELGWIRNVMRAAVIQASARRSRERDGLATVMAEWIGEPSGDGQLGYYAYKAEQRTRAHHHTQWLERALLTLVITASLLLALFHHWLDPDTTTSLVALMGVLAIIAAARESYSYRKADKELIKQYRYMGGIFASARRQLDATRDPDAQRDVLRALGEAALAEHAEWALMHRERPLEHGKL